MDFGLPVAVPQSHPEKGTLEEYVPILAALVVQGRGNICPLGHNAEQGMER